MDSSITRRGQPCYYRIPEVNTIAINDGMMLSGAIYHVLRTYFRSESYYVDLLELFHDVRTSLFHTHGSSTYGPAFRLQITYRTEIGQLIDLITAPEHTVDLSKFSLKRCALS